MLHSAEQMTCRVNLALNGSPHWRQSGIVVLRNFCFMAAILSVGACSTTVFDPRACPTERKYTKAEQDQFLKDLPTTPASIQGAMVDYGKLRDKARACRGVKAP